MPSIVKDDDAAGQRPAGAGDTSLPARGGHPRGRRLASYCDRVCRAAQRGEPGPAAGGRRWAWSASVTGWTASIRLGESPRRPPAARDWLADQRLARFEQREPGDRHVHREDERHGLAEIVVDPPSQPHGSTIAPKSSSISMIAAASRATSVPRLPFATPICSSVAGDCPIRPTSVRGPVVRTRASPLSHVMS